MPEDRQLIDSCKGGLPNAVMVGEEYGGKLSKFVFFFPV